ncbi:MAG: hypothetical protein RBR71_03240 [Gudongella sp.]|nr:hypothetical protein [Gudongella sp.]
MDKTCNIYILLSHSGSNFSRAINAYTGDSYTHISISLDEELKEVYSFGRLHPYNPFLAGFVREDVENGTFRRFPNTFCSLYSLKVEEAQRESIISEIGRFKSESYKYGYNFLGLFTALFNIPLPRKYNYFCSQFVSEVLLKSGINVTDKHPGLTSPMDIMSYSELEFIYTGYLNEYKVSVLELVV